ncbi:cobalt-precorrin 5A hydrolase/precorrin-3B C17-methyltransferase [Tamaricihabitans halophyticus]|uniref:Cobalt-precorrin 5A hydrolase/precorrin-3B C17-methyltransferase n=1 Tax=Tamaricihabitans halophyticus TaxID=1262583 RepID=A0A4R2QPC5_9PSEU|nr:precorrin-3B C(17)-methyltransferase [Tamaricihabitans halophyticus]TCP50794.1 cobalt-precorrin 5A hydrolase/precorrin-3B C17-methyltransferase [Tamaricihabitans halophyticus]
MIALFAVTPSGRQAAAALAAYLGPDAAVVDGPPRAGIERLWSRLDAAVFFLAAGATVRLIAPLLRDKRTDPAVICVDEAQRFAVPLVGGHAGGANDLAERIASALLDCTPVITTASDSVGVTPLDELVEQLGAAVDGDLAGCGVALLGGEPILLRNPLGFPLPALPDNVSVDIADPEWTIVIDDRVPARPDDPSVLRLVPRTVVIGLGSARGVTRTAVANTIAELHERAGLDARAVRGFATVDLKADERGIIEAVGDWGFWNGEGRAGLLTYPAETLAAIPVPNPSSVVESEVGTPSVAEASALCGAAELGGARSAELVAEKIKGANVTAAAARVRPRGRLAIVGLGPGAAELRTPKAEAELRRASTIVGLDQYVDQIRPLLRRGTDVRASGLGDEEARAAEAVALAAEGRSVALIGSGDAGIYAMASPALEQAGADIEVVGVPGITAALAAAAALGAPLGHDHALISLSDLHTPWEAIERRVRAAAEADLVVCFYNPRSAQRDWQLRSALRILGAHRPATTPVGAVRQASRHGERVWTEPIAEFAVENVDMLTTVLVGSSRTQMVAGRMVTPRGYTWMPSTE